jgi:hypothetical protein
MVRKAQSFFARAFPIVIFVLIGAFGFLWLASADPVKHPHHHLSRAAAAHARYLAHLHRLTHLRALLRAEEARY